MVEKKEEGKPVCGTLPVTTLLGKRERWQDAVCGRSGFGREFALAVALDRTVSGRGIAATPMLFAARVAVPVKARGP